MNIRLGEQRIYIQFDHIFYKQIAYLLIIIHCTIFYPLLQETKKKKERHLLILFNCSLFVILYTVRQLFETKKLRYLLPQIRQEPIWNLFIIQGMFYMVVL